VAWSWVLRAACRYNATCYHNIQRSGVEWSPSWGDAVSEGKARGVSPGFLRWWGSGDSMVDETHSISRSLPLRPILAPTRDHLPVLDRATRKVKML